MYSSATQIRNNNSKLLGAQTAPVFCISLPVGYMFVIKPWVRDCTSAQCRGPATLQKCLSTARVAAVYITTAW